MKYGFKTFIAKAHPIQHPRRPFDKRRDLRRETKGLFVYLTAAGKIAKRSRDHKEPIEFHSYQADKAAAFVWLRKRRKWIWVPLDAIHISDQQETA